MKKGIILVVGLIVLGCTLLSAACRSSRKEPGTVSGQEKPPYSSFEAGSVDEIPWDENSTVEDYK